MDNLSFVVTAGNSGNAGSTKFELPGKFDGASLAHARSIHNDVRMTKLTLALAASLIAVPATSNAQSPATDPNCTYESCALGLAPVWNGLAITRGISQRQIANLGFFWPEDIRPVFLGDEPALEAATEAMQMRTVAAILTDAGLVLLGTGLARAGFQREFDGLSRVLTGIGAGAFVVSVPFHFAADGILSRAVWWHNRRYVR
jgi:hypothetical protein